MANTIELTLKDGTRAKSGDLIRWHCFDNDDFVTWTFTGIFKGNKVIYLGGGCDFGRAVGKEIEVSEVIKDSENNDSHQVGVEKIGTAMDIVRHIGKFPLTPNKAKS